VKFFSGIDATVIFIAFVEVPVNGVEFCKCIFDLERDVM
jgi:hypothetical protein